jgi:hypothetical protein
MKSVLLESRMHGNHARTVREGADENVRNATRQPPTLPRVSASAVYVKPLSNIVKATITWETRGVWPFRQKTAPRKGQL